MTYLNSTPYSNEVDPYQDLKDDNLMLGIILTAQLISPKEWQEALKDFEAMTGREYEG